MQRSEPEDKVGPGETRYLYAFGTPSGRAGSAYLSRVPEDDMTDLTKYEYWDGSEWVQGNAAVAVPIIGDSTHSTGLFGFVVDWANNPKVFGGYLGGLFGAKTGGNVSEMSVQYNEYLGKYVVLYADRNNDVQMRTADEPEGPWSDPITIATSAQYPGRTAHDDRWHNCAQSRQAAPPRIGGPPLVRYAGGARDRTRD